MPEPRPTSRVARLSSAVALLSATIVVGFAGSSQAAPGQPTNPPRTAAEALRQLNDFNSKFEQVTEKYNEAGIALKKRKAEAVVAAKKAKTAGDQYAALDVQVRRVITTANVSDPAFGEFGAIFSSGNAQEYLDKAAVLDLLTKRRSALLTQAGKVRTAAVKAKADANAKVVTAMKLSQSLAKQKVELSRKAAESKRLLNSLSARERARYLAAQSRPDPEISTTRTSAGESSSSEDSGSTSVPGSGGASTAVAVAKQQLGKPYVWAAEGPGQYDCSGLTLYAWGKAGVSLPHSSAQQINYGQRVAKSALQPGDLVFFNSPISHVGIYVGGGQMIHAPTTGDVVKYASIDIMDFAGASRPGT